MLECGPHVRFGDRPQADVVETAVVGLTDHGIDRSHLLHVRLRQQPADHRVGGSPYTQGAGEEKRRLELRVLLELRHAQELPEAVHHEEGGGHSFSKDIAAVWQNRCDTGVDRIPRVNRRVSHPDAGDVGDRIQRAGGEHPDDDPDIACTWPRRHLTAKGERGEEGAGHERQRGVRTL